MLYCLYPPVTRYPLLFLCIQFLSSFQSDVVDNRLIQNKLYFIFPIVILNLYIFRFTIQNFMSASTPAIDVAYLARLARIQLTTDEEVLFTSQLERVLEHIAKINTLDLSGIEPTAHAISVFDVVREDVVGESLPKQVVLEQAPHQANGLFVVPKVLE